MQRGGRAGREAGAPGRVEVEERARTRSAASLPARAAASIVPSSRSARDRSTMASLEQHMRAVAAELDRAR